MEHRQRESIASKYNQWPKRLSDGRKALESSMRVQYALPDWKPRDVMVMPSQSKNERTRAKASPKVAVDLMLMQKSRCGSSTTLQSMVKPCKPAVTMQSAYLRIVCRLQGLLGGTTSPSREPAMRCEKRLLSDGDFCQDWYWKREVSSQ